MDSEHVLTLSFFIILSLLSVSSVQLPVLDDDENIIHVPSIRFDPTRVTQLSSHPRAFLFKGFLSDNECDHLINAARNKLEQSRVSDKKTGKSKLSTTRTSSGMFLLKAQDEVIANIEARIATWTFLPLENGEGIQILRYEHGQKYEPHFDFSTHNINLQFGGYRIATVLMYLSNVHRGGETVFPNSDPTISQAKDESWSECSRKGYAVKAVKGDALLFFSLHPNATTDVRSLHGSCPVIEGEKWSATKWIHIRDFANSYKQVYSNNCSDENENCSIWAKRGECKKNPLYMVGNETMRGYCMKSCNVCSS